MSASATASVTAHATYAMPRRLPSPVRAPRPRRSAHAERLAQLERARTGGPAPTDEPGVRDLHERCATRALTPRQRDVAFVLAGRVLRRYPLFLVAPRYERTSAELPAEEKNLISHRAHAARLMLAQLKRVLSP